MSHKISKEELQQELKDKYGFTLVQEYINAHTDIVFLCSNGHKNIAKQNNVRRRGYTCKECQHGRYIQPKKQWTQQELEHLVELVDQGIAAKECSVVFNTTEQALRKTCEQLNIQFDPSINTSKALATILAHQGRSANIPSSIRNTDKILITCQNGHTLKQEVRVVLYQKQICAACSQEKTTSKPEEELRTFISEQYQGWIVYNDRTVLEGKELDIVLPDKSLAFEFNGIYWHQDKKVPINYHKDKTIKAEENDYQLIHIQDYLWHTKQDIVKSRIKQLLGKSIKIPARKTVIKQIPFPREFLDNNHLQGAGSPTSINYALYYKDEIVAVITFGKPRFTSNQEWELVRFATKQGVSVQGGASKLFKHFVKKNNPNSIVSYAARDFSRGNLYITLGFKHQHNSEPGYAYYKRLNKISRYQAQKHKLEKLLPLYDPKLSESENMALNGYYKVYDSGNMVFTWAP